MVINIYRFIVSTDKCKTIIFNLRPFCSTSKSQLMYPADKFVISVVVMSPKHSPDISRFLKNIPDFTGILTPQTDVNLL